MKDGLMVPLDGCARSELALPYAEAIAAHSAQPLLLLHVLEKAVPHKKHGEIHLSSLEEAQKYLRGLAGELTGKGFSVDWHVHDVAVRDLPQSLRSHEEEFRFSLSILVSHGAFGWRRVLHQGVGWQVIGKSIHPLLLIPDRFGAEGAANLGSDVFLALDPSGEHEIDYQTLAEVLSRFPASTARSVTLISVLERSVDLKDSQRFSRLFSPSTTNEFLRIQEADIEAQLEEKCANLKKLFGASVEIKASLLRGDPARVIERASRRGSLLVLPTHGRPEVFWSESVAGRVTGSARIPLLLIPMETGARHG